MAAILRPVIQVISAAHQRLSSTWKVSPDLKSATPAPSNAIASLNSEVANVTDEVNRIKQLAMSGDENTRQHVRGMLNELLHSMDDTNDTIHRFGYLHLQTAAVKVGFNLGLFVLLSGAEGPLTLEQIAEHVKADPAFLGRYLSYLASISVIRQIGKFQYAANNTTKNLAEKVAEAGISHCFETIGPMYQALPSFLASHAYPNPQNERATVFQSAFSTDQHCFEWMSKHPQLSGFFHEYMALRRRPTLSWLSAYPLEAEIQGFDEPERALYVNIGGGVGHQCREFRERVPEAKGRVVLQDLPHTIAKAMNTPGVENMAHDFFEEQPVKGAKYYFLRGVCHNHPDAKVKQLLRRTRDAMATDSILLLDEWVLPESGVNSYATSMDLTMMAAFAGAERTEAQWRSILEESGLTLVEAYVYNPVSYETVMKIRLM